MKKILTKLDIYSGIGMIVALILFFCCYITEKIAGACPAWMYNVTNVILVVSLISVTICYVYTVFELVRDLWLARKNNKK